MAVPEQTREAIVESLRRIGQESQTVFREFVIEDHTQGKYRAGTWTFRLAPGRVALEYWFSAFSSRRDEVAVTYAKDGDAAKLDRDLRGCFEAVRAAVRRKKGMF